MLADWVRIEVIRLGYIVRFPHTQTYMEMVTTLCERWHSETMMFHLPMGEMTVTLEDIYWIFRFPVWGTPVMMTRLRSLEVIV